VQPLGIYYEYTVHIKRLNCIANIYKTVLVFFMEMRLFEPQRATAQHPAPTLVEQVIAALQRAVQQRILPPGSPVPSIRRFARTHAISPYTVSQAYGRLVAQGWLFSRPGSGYWVAPLPPGTPALKTAAQTHSPGADLQSWQPPKVGERWLLEDVFADHSIPIKSGCGWLPTEWLRRSGLDTALRSLTRVPLGQLSGYGHPYGYFPLREFLTQHLAQYGLQVNTQQILLTQGATQALDLVLGALLQPGDTVLVEVPCYANVLSMLRMHGIKVVGVPRDATGFDLQVLEEQLKQHPARLFFTNPILHNPTGSSLSFEQAFQLLGLLQRHGVQIIEDDVSRLLTAGQAPVLAAMGGVNQVIYVGSFSKSIAPSTRVGYVVGSAPLIEALASRKMALGLTTPELMERLVHQVVSGGRYQQHVNGMQTKLMQAHHHFYEQCEVLDMQVWAQPYAGLFAWARLPASVRTRTASTVQLAQRALQSGIWLAPGSYFYPQGDDHGWMRFNVAHSQAPELWDFLAQAQAQL